MRINSVVSFIFIWFIFSFSSLIASGLGIAFTYGSGTTDYDLYEADANQIGINFVFDTNVAKRSVFNYRLTIGAEDFEQEYYDPYIYNYSYTSSHIGIRNVTDHVFGFAIVKSSNVRLWMGPSVRIGVFRTSNRDLGYTVGAGVTGLGLNFNMGRIFTLALEVDYLYNFDRCYVQDNNNGDVVYESIESSLTKLFIVKLFILFRIKDTYDDIF